MRSRGRYKMRLWYGANDRQVMCREEYATDANQWTRVIADALFMHPQSMRWKFKKRTCSKMLSKCKEVCKCTAITIRLRSAWRLVPLFVQHSVTLTPPSFVHCLPTTNAKTTGTQRTKNVQPENEPPRTEHPVCVEHMLLL